jgi:integrase
MINKFNGRKDLLDYLTKNQHKRGKDIGESSLATYHLDIWDYLEYYRDYANDELVHEGTLPHTLEEGYINILASKYGYYTLEKKIAAIKFYLHISDQKNIFDTPQVRAQISRIKRYKDLNQKQAPAFTNEEFKKVLRGFDTSTPLGLRNKAMFLVWLYTASRVSELRAWCVKDIEHHEKGLKLWLGVTKNNQYGEPKYKPLFHKEDNEFDPVNWLLKLKKMLPDDPEQPLFAKFGKGEFAKTPLSKSALDNLVKKSFGKEYSSHSFRSSLITIAIEQDIPYTAIMRLTHHSDIEMIKRYTRFKDDMEHNAGDILDL